VAERGKGVAPKTPSDKASRKLDANQVWVGSSMSSYEHQNRPSSAIYLGQSSPAGQDAVLLQTSFSTPTTPHTAALHAGRLAQLPSPPHTNSTSGSTGDKDSANAGSVRRSGAPLLPVHDEESSITGRMQNGNDFDNEDDDDDLTRRQGLDIQDPANKHRITPKIERVRSLAEKNREVCIFFLPIFVLRELTTFYSRFFLPRDSVKSSLSSATSHDN
jgi:hypothetical protein